MDTLSLPHPDEIRRRIASCEGELKALRKLLRAAQDAHDADDFRRQRAADRTTPALVLLLSPTLRQSGELFKDKVRRLYNALGRPVRCVQETQLTMELTNGSRIVALPGEEGTIRGYSGVLLLVCDEAARIPDALYFSVRPMLAVSGGLLVALSTPFGRRGWFYETDGFTGCV
jgi:hypothetical protein